jgi:hypothetical protein
VLSSQAEDLLLLITIKSSFALIILVAVLSTVEAAVLAFYNIFLNCIAYYYYLQTLFLFEYIHELMSSSTRRRGYYEYVGDAQQQQQEQELAPLQRLLLPL